MFLVIVLLTCFVDYSRERTKFFKDTRINPSIEADFTTSILLRWTCFQTYNVLVFSPNVSYISILLLLFHCMLERTQLSSDWLLLAQHDRCWCFLFRSRMPRNIISKDCLSNVKTCRVIISFYLWSKIYQLLGWRALSIMKFFYHKLLQFANF